MHKPSKHSPHLTEEGISNLVSWFSNSVFLQDGEPKIFYRGESQGGDFTEFSRRQTYENAFFFTEEFEVAKDYARGQEPRSFYLRAENIIDLSKDTEDGRKFVMEWAEVWLDDGWIDRTSGEPVDPFDVVIGGRLFDYEGDWSQERWRDLQGSIQAAGYDGAILADSHSLGRLMLSTIVFDPAQIKSTQNSGLFDPKSNDIYDGGIELTKAAISTGCKLSDIQQTKEKGPLAGPSFTPG